MDTRRADVRLTLSSRRHGCPCCGCLTLTREPPGTFEVCEVCFWEDDPVQFEDPAYRGGANAVSLTEARANFAHYGAVDEGARESVLPARPEERP
jgi:hypothetical protein